MDTLSPIVADSERNLVADKADSAIAETRPASWMDMVSFPFGYSQTADSLTLSPIPKYTL